MAGQVEQREACVKNVTFPAWDHSMPISRRRYINKDKSTPTPRWTRQLGTSRRVIQSQHIKNGQPAPIRQGVICWQRPKRVGLSVTIQKGVTSFDTKRADGGLPCCRLISLHLPDWWPPRISMPTATADRTVLPPATPRNLTVHLQPSRHAVQSSQSEARLTYHTTISNNSTVLYEPQTK